MSKDLQTMKRSHKTTSEAIKKARVLFNQTKDSIARKSVKGNLKTSDIQSIQNDISKISDRINSVTNEVSEIGAGIGRKKESYNQMDLEAKLRRREKQLNEVTGYLGEIDQAITDLSEDITKDITKASENPKDNIDVMKKMVNQRDSCEKVKLLCQELGETNTGIMELIHQNLQIISQHDPDNFSETYEILWANIEIKLAIKDLIARLTALQKRVNEIRDQFKNSKKGGIKYKAAKGDEIDQLLGEWLNLHGCPIQIQRIGGGYYMFGTRKIYAKVINGKLVIRVGGGYMGIDEFMKHYGQQELDKQRRMGIAADSSPGGKTINEFGDRKVVGGSALKKSFRGHQTPKKTEGSMRGNFGNSRFSSKSFAGPAKGSPESIGVSDLEAQLRALEKDAAEGNIGDGYNIMNAKKGKK